LVLSILIGLIEILYIQGKENPFKSEFGPKWIPTTAIFVASSVFDSMVKSFCCAIEQCHQMFDAK